jgi:excisionase family DNA binding protein
MEATQSYPNLLSEKQAAKRLGVARITLLRAREAGRIRFFRIGTRVLYCEEQLTEFLASCEGNSREEQDDERHMARRKDNQVSSARRSSSARAEASVDSAPVSAGDQASLPFLATG